MIKEKVRFVNDFMTIEIVLSQQTDIEMGILFVAEIKIKHAGFGI